MWIQPTKGRPIVTRWGCTLLTMCTLVVFPTAARAQTEGPGVYNPTSRTDAYGNVRPRYNERRSVAIFSSEFERRAARGVQDADRRDNRRGGLLPFRLSSDMPSGISIPSASDISSAFGLPPGPASSALQRRLFAQYGGFGPRRLGQKEVGDVTASLSRRYALVQATGGRSPVYRALLLHGMAYPESSSPTKRFSAAVPGHTDGLPGRTAGQGPSTRDSPNRPAGQQSTTAPNRPMSDARPAIDQYLRGGAERTYARTIADAWSLFRSGKYRRAARLFETASFIEPMSMEARIGELFCYVTLGNGHTAMAVFSEIIVRTDAPFRADVSVADAYGSAADARRVRLQAQWQTQVEGDNPDAVALRALILWYLGQRHEARLAAEALGRNHPGSIYAEWATRMREVEASEDVSEPGSAP